MSSWTNGQVVVGLLSAGLLFIIDLGLSVALCAVGALSRVSLHRLSAEDEPRMSFLSDIQEPLSRHRVSARLGRQLSLLIGTALLAASLRGAGLGFPIIVGFGTAALLVVLIGEGLLARGLALWKPRTALRWTVPFVRASATLLYPIARPLTRALTGIDDSQQLTEEQREEEQEEEVEALIEVGEREGLLEAEEGAMMRGIIDLDETLVREIMTPRTEIAALPVETTVDQARQAVQEAGHSRLPVFRGSIDNVIGVLHARDLFRAWQEQSERATIAAYLRPATYVPELLSAADLLSRMKLRSHLAVVVDEYGGVAGLVTLEDLLEEIVGEIRDEHEPEEEELVQQNEDGSYLINAVAHVGELERLFGVEFEDRDFDTVGGLVVSTVGRVPGAGETVEVAGLSIEVLKADRRRILRVRVRRVPPKPGEAHAGP
jgi:magnesium and cobalt transporter